MKIPMISKRQFNKLKKFFPVPRGNKILDDRIFLAAASELSIQVPFGAKCMKYMANLIPYAKNSLVGASRESSEEYSRPSQLNVESAISR